MAGSGRGGRRRYVFVLLVLTAVTFITLDQREGDSGPVGTLGRFAHRVVAPVSDVASNVMSPVSDWFDGVLHAGSLKHDNAKLKREIEAERLKVLRGQSALVQNKLLTQLMHQPYLDLIKSETASVVAFSPGNFERTITLDRGTDAGIEQGMPVVAADGLVGRVDQSWNGGSTVLLLEDPHFAVGVRMVKHRNTGAAQGQAGLTSLSVELSGPLRVRDRPRRGELAITSGLEGSTFPPGIPVGTVESLTISDDGLSIDARLAPVVDIANLEYVKVLKWHPGSVVPPQLSSTMTVPTTTTTTTATAPTSTTTTTGP